VIRRVLLLACLAVACSATAFAAGKPVIRVAFQPSGTVVVGRQVKLTVTILVPNFFLSAPDWPTLDVDGAVVTTPDEVMPHLTETIDGDSYAGVQKLYVIAPQQDGEITLPAVEIHFKYSAVPGQPPVDGVVTLPAAHFTAAWPEGARTDAGVLPVARLTVQQTLDRRGTSFKTGETLTRTITAVAAHTQPMMILPPAISAPDGVRVYEKDPVLSTDLGTRGELNAGRRVDHVTYLFEKPGRYTLPAIEYPWFDAAAKKRMSAVAPAITVDVAQAAAAAAIPPEAPPPPPPAPPPSPWAAWKKRLPWIAEGLAALVAAIWLAQRLWPRYRAWSTARRHERTESEPAYFTKFEDACSANDAARAYAALARWAWRADHRSIASFCGALGSDGFTKEVSALEQRLFAAGPPSASAWSGGALRVAASHARHRWLDSRDHREGQRSYLPALNP
jgi:hypothetical protein